MMKKERKTHRSDDNHVAAAAHAATRIRASNMACRRRRRRPTMKKKDVSPSLINTRRQALKRRTTHHARHHEAQVAHRVDGGELDGHRSDESRFADVRGEGNCPNGPLFFSPSVPLRGGLQKRSTKHHSPRHEPDGAVHERHLVRYRPFGGREVPAVEHKHGGRLRHDDPGE